ncbi:unnamed protein product [Pleuronectes platessa]|uniref:Macro domain-containing protein n=1 Tax=Pleuronectes platessa TaxID=8262 RepID=A0A9N7Z104_PLEPL|nr:unnamed protein product [Pleuronectes platessa]
MKSHCVKNGVTRISMPRIGCGLDRLEWRRVEEILEQVFKHTDISITVYSLPVKAETTVRKENIITATNPPPFPPPPPPPSSSLPIPLHAWQLDSSLQQSHLATLHVSEPVEKGKSVVSRKERPAQKASFCAHGSLVLQYPITSLSGAASASSQCRAEQPKPATTALT